MERSAIEVPIEKVSGAALSAAMDVLAVEEPLEIQLRSGPTSNRETKSIAVTMRTPGHDLELAIGFLATEGIVHERADVERYGYAAAAVPHGAGPDEKPLPILRDQTGPNAVRVELAPHLAVSDAQLARHFYTTSSCGVCGKASLMALRTVCPPRAPNRFSIDAGALYALPRRLREAQSVFDRTGGLHGAALFDAEARLMAVREDVGRHNAVDKLIGHQFLQGRLPLCDTLLMLSGRASFELLQKASMAGVSMVAAVGAPSSLAVQTAREFDIALVGFLRDDRFNIYHGAEHVSGLGGRTGAAGQL